MQKKKTLYRCENSEIYKYDIVIVITWKVNSMYDYEVILKMKYICKTVCMYCVNNVDTVWARSYRSRYGPRFSDKWAWDKCLWYTRCSVTVFLRELGGEGGTEFIDPVTPLKKYLGVSGLCPPPWGNWPISCTRTRALGETCDSSSTTRCHCERTETHARTGLYTYLPTCIHVYVLVLTHTGETSLTMYS